MFPLHARRACMSQAMACGRDLGAQLGRSSAKSITCRDNANTGLDPPPLEHTYYFKFWCLLFRPGFLKYDDSDL
jgi:hypothetical protein